jgi:hypothetical protein
MSNLVAFGGANLPSVTSLASALRRVQTDTGFEGGALLRMDKTGCWVFGSDQTEVEEDSQWAVNPFSFIHGWIAWGEGEVLGEAMASITEPLPALAEAPAGAKKGWEKQVGMSLKCMSGEDEGIDVRYTVTSVGGKKAVQALAVAIATQVEADEKKPVPVVTLGTDSYKHKTYGKIFTPEFNVVKWIGMDGPEAEAEEAEEAESEVEEPRRRRRRASAD